MKIAPAVNGLEAWSTLGLRWMEMVAASGAVIAHRTSRAQTPAQWLSIGSEKMVAAMESSLAMSRHLARFPAGDPVAAWAAWGRMLGGGVRPYRTRAVRNARSLRRR